MRRACGVAKRESIARGAVIAGGRESTPSTMVTVTIVDARVHALVWQRMARFIGHDVLQQQLLPFVNGLPAANVTTATKNAASVRRIIAILTEQCTSCFF